MTGDSSNAVSEALRHHRAMSTGRRSVSDEVHGLRAVSALVAGEFEDAVDELGQVSARYLVGFLLRFSLLSPSVAARLAWTLVRERI